LKTQIGEFVNKLEDYLNSQIGIHFLQDNRRRPTLIAGDLVFDFTNHPEFATLQQWDGEKLIPLDLSAISGYIDLVAQGIGSGTDASLFLRSDGAGHWVLAAGPVGPAGPIGDPGAPGADGADGISAYQVAVNNGFVGTEADWLMSLVGPPGVDGADGADGSVWYNGAGVPGGGLGIDGDYYIRTSNGDVYFKSAGTWAIILNITGPPGANGTNGTNGTNGIDGSVWYNGTGVPAGGLGVNGDYYIRTSNGDVYFKSAGSWSVILNITGPAGAAGATGAGAVTLHGSGNPASGLGSDGQLYINEQQGDLWLKISGTWTLYGANAYYFQGKAFLTIAPNNGDVITYDSSLSGGVGAWKGAAPVGAFDDETRARLNLAIL
jgi:hypothetical protein